MEADEQPERISIALGDEARGQRLDRFLAARLGISRSETRSLLARGGVALAGRTLGYGDKGLTLPAEGRLEVAPFRPVALQRADADPELSVPVLAEGPGWMAVDKPAGMPVHPLREDETGTVANAVLARHPEAFSVGEGGLRSGVVHRLDVDTSGVLLFATREPAWQRLREAFREHRVHKTYRAVVAGALPERLEGPVAFELAVARHRPARVRVVDDSWGRGQRAYPARQEMRVVERLAGATLVEVALETGFLHQIRVILAYLGHPVVGDALYGSEESLRLGGKRQMLHAARLRFEEIEASSPDPDDFRACLSRLGANQEEGA